MGANSVGMRAAGAVRRAARQATASVSKPAVAQGVATVLGADAVALSAVARTPKPMAPAQLTLKARGMLAKAGISEADALKILRAADRVFKRELTSGKTQVEALAAASASIGRKLPEGTADDLISAVANGLRPQYRSLKKKADEAIANGRVTRTPKPKPAPVTPTPTVIKPLPTPQVITPKVPTPPQIPVTTGQGTRLARELRDIKDGLISAGAGAYVAGEFARRTLQGDAQTLSGGIRQHWQNAWMRHDKAYQGQLEKISTNAGELANRMGQWFSHNLLG